MTHSPVTNSAILPGELEAYLSKCGLSKTAISECRLDTRLYHDLGIYGDIAEAYMEVLSDSFGVDLSAFNFDIYFPPEFPGKSSLTIFLVSHVPFGRWLYRKLSAPEYSPLTLKILLDALRAGRFQD